jgi:hypothetical protein
LAPESQTSLEASSSPLKSQSFVTIVSTLNLLLLIQN